MTLRWVRLDTAFPRNHKILTLIGQKDGHRAAFVFACGLSYCGEQGTDGFIPREALSFIHARVSDANRLVSVGLWWPETGGWMVNGWDEFQPTTEETKRRSDKARLAAAARWAKARKDAPGNAPSNAAGAKHERTNERTNEDPPTLQTNRGLSDAREIRALAVIDGGVA